MTLRLSPTQNRWLAVGLLVLALVFIYAGLVLPLLHVYQQNRQGMEQSQQHIGRLVRIAAGHDLLERRVRQLEQNRELVRYTLSEQSTTLAAAALQERVKSAVERGGGELTSTRILPAIANGSFYRVTVNVQMRVSTEALQSVFYDLESGVPYLLIENVTILSRTRGARYRSSVPVKHQDLEIRFDLSGLMPAENT